MGMRDHSPDPFAAVSRDTVCAVAIGASVAEPPPELRDAADDELLNLFMRGVKTTLLTGDDRDALAPYAATMLVRAEILRRMAR
jgi:hypothetical protein